MKLWLSGTLLFSMIATTTLANERVAFPQNYRQTFTEYQAINRALNPDQFIRIFANDIAIRSQRNQGKLEYGAVLVAEIYSVKKNSDDTVKVDAEGNRIQDQLLFIEVLEKQAAFGETPNTVLPTGDWDFAAYQANGLIASKNLNECRACHMPQVRSDFLFSPEQLSVPQ